MWKIVIVLILFAGPAFAQRTLTDTFGATVTANGKGVYTRGGVTIVAPTDADAMKVFNGMAPDGWTPPPQPVATMLPAGDFVERFTPAEVAALIAWNPALVMRVTSAGTIDTASPKLRAGFAAAVAVGKLTQARADQILDLSRSSP